METPTTPDELFRAFQALGYRNTLALFGAVHLCRHFTPREIVAIAWEAGEVDERTNYNRRRQILALVCGTGATGSPPFPFP